MFCPITAEQAERLRRARRHLARARMHVRRLAWLARDPSRLDAHLPLLSATGFARSLARYQSIRLPEEATTLLILLPAAADASLRRQIALLLLESTRNCDTLGCLDDAFLVLLKGADEAGAHAAGERLRRKIRKLAARNRRLLRVDVHHLPITPEVRVAEVMDFARRVAAEAREFACASRPQAARAG